MIKLFCDRCNKEILPEEYSLHLEMQEEVYKGKNDFFIEGILHINPSFNKIILSNV